MAVMCLAIVMTLVDQQYCLASANSLFAHGMLAAEAERTPVWLMRQAGRYMAEFRAYSDKYPFRMRSETPDIAIELSLQVRWRAGAYSSSSSCSSAELGQHTSAAWHSNAQCAGTAG
jgi:hypothetical protein